MLKSCDVGNDHHSMSRYPHEQTYLINDSCIVYSRNQYNYFSTCTSNSYISYHLLHMIHPGLDDYPNLLFSFNKNNGTYGTWTCETSWRLKRSHRRCPGPSWTSSQVKQSGNIFLRNIVLPGGFFAKLVVHAFGGPQPVIKRPYYKWPKIRWISLGLFHPPFRSYFTSFITGSGDHQLWVGGVFGPKFVETSPFLGRRISGNRGSKFGQICSFWRSKIQKGLRSGFWKFGKDLNFEMMDPGPCVFF